MEELTKQQIVLVTLLISFVTSIATGIITVALMDQAPPGVTQTINRVVEKTIEKVVPGPTQQAAAVVTKETVVVKEDDLIVSAVEKNTKSLVAIRKIVAEGDGTQDIFVGNGLIVGKDGLIATDAVIAEPTLDDNQNLTPQTFKTVLSDGTVLPLSILSSNNKSGVVFFKPTLDDKTKAPVFVPATVADVGALKLGQTVISLSGEKVSVATGIVSSLYPSGATSVASSTSVTLIQTDIRGGEKNPGAILVNLSGDVVGIRTTSSGVSANIFLPAGAIGKP